MKKSWITNTIVPIAFLLIWLFFIDSFNDIAKSLYVSLGMLGVGVVAILIFRNPLYGLMLIIFINVFDDMIPLPGIGTVGRFIGVIVAVSWILKYVFMQKTYFFHSKGVNMTALCFIISMIISSLLAQFPMQSLKNAFTITLLILMMFFIQDFIDNKKDLKLFLMTIALSVGIASLFGFVQYKFLGYGENILGTVTVEGDVQRLAGFQSNANALGILLTAGIPILLFLALNTNKFTFKLIYILLFFTSITSMALTISRTHIYGFLLFLFIFISLGFMYKKINMKHLIYLLTILIISASISYMVLNEMISDRKFDRTMTINDDSSKARVLIFQKGVKALLEHPFFGIGFNHLELLYWSDNKYGHERRPGHDVVSVVFTSTGFFGGLIFIVLCYKAIYYFKMAIKNFGNGNQKYLQNLSIILLSAFLALLLTGLGNPLIFQRILWIYIAFSVVLYRWSETQGVSTRSIVGEK